MEENKNCEEQILDDHKKVIISMTIHFVPEGIFTRSCFEENTHAALNAVKTKSGEKRRERMAIAQPQLLFASL